MPEEGELEHEDSLTTPVLSRWHIDKKISERLERGSARCEPTASRRLPFLPSLQGEAQKDQAQALRMAAGP